MIRTYKYRLYPGKKQAEQLDFMLWQMRNVYNDALSERKWRWDRSRLSTSYNDQWKRFKQARKEFPDTIGQLSATAMQQMLRRLDKSYRACYKGVRGLPRFKGRSRFKSLEYRHGDGCKLRGKRFYVYRVGEIRMKLHRPIPADAKLGQVIIKRQPGKWYVFFQLHLPDVVPPKHSGPEIGIDVGFKTLLALSDGTLIDNPRWLRSRLARMRVLQRKLARQKRGGANWKKTKFAIARLHEKIANQRKDFWHKATRYLAEAHSVIHTENLRLAFMLKGKLALSAHDAALGMFFSLLDYKVAETGSREVKKNPRNTTIDCSGCGAAVPKTLSAGIHACPHCGLVLDRDTNAAINILNKAWTEPSGLNLSGYAVSVPGSSPF